MPTEYRKCRNAEPDNPRLPEPVRNLDRQKAAIGFRTDLGSYKNGKDLDDAVDCFVDNYGYEIRQVEAFDRQTGEPLRGFTTLYGKG